MLGGMALEADCVGLVSTLATHKLCDLGCVTSPLCTSVASPSSIEDKNGACPTGELGG